MELRRSAAMMKYMKRDCMRKKSQQCARRAMSDDARNAERRFRLLRGSLWRCVGRGQGAKKIAGIDATMSAVFTYKLNKNTLVFEKGNEGEVRETKEGE